MLKENSIYCGDNIDVLKGFDKECVDLCYIDPPFFTSRNYEVVFGDGAEVRAFQDRWVKMGNTGRYSKDINVYLDFMEPRIKELHRVLKKTGTFYLHCDDSANSYLRILCDSIFGYNNMLNAIIWHYDQGARGKKSFGWKHDTILVYSKNHDYTFNWKEIVEPFKSGMTEWRYTKGGQAGKEMPPGKVPSDVWNMGFNSMSNERLGYPTQKPEALLERIVKASSNEGDIILDAFAGCGTTISVAKRLNRKFVGIDISPTACRLIANRIGYPLGQIIGLPFNADEIAALDGHEFQNAMITMLDPSLNTIKVGKKGPDGGIDGTYHDLLISVKKFKAGRKELDEFVATMYRNKMKIGIFIALDYTADFIKEISRLDREQNMKVHAFTFQQIVAREHEKILQDARLTHGKVI